MADISRLDKQSWKQRNWEETGLAKSKAPIRFTLGDSSYTVKMSNSFPIGGEPSAAFDTRFVHTYDEKGQTGTIRVKGDYAPLQITIRDSKSKETVETRGFMTKDGRIFIFTDQKNPPNGINVSYSQGAAEADGVNYAVLGDAPEEEVTEALTFADSVILSPKARAEKEAAKMNAQAATTAGTVGATKTTANTPRHTIMDTITDLIRYLVPSFGYRNDTLQH